MSGGEAVVGIVLGVLPLVLSATEHYGNVHRIYRRFKSFRHGVRELTENLSIQATIFNTETELLLVSAFGSIAAREMLADEKHPRWTDGDSEATINAVLGPATSALLLAAESIDRKLCDLENKGYEFEATLEPEPQQGSSRYKQWRRSVREQFRFAFSEKELRRALKAVRNLTQDYRTLRAQTIEVNRSIPAQRTQSLELKDIEDLRNVQDAASMTYDALATACTKHTEHHAYFSLQPTYSHASTSVRFSLAFSTPRNASTIDPKGLVWFMIESISGNHVDGQACTRATTQILHVGSSKRAADSSDVAKPSKKVRDNARKVRFRSESPSAFTCVPSFDSTLPNLCSHKNFCTHLMSSWVNRIIEGERCIGRLDSLAPWKHRVYLTPGPNVNLLDQNRQSSTSLFSLLTATGSSGIHFQGLALFQRVRLARVLATALLYYYPTPWVKPSWSSRDIQVYGASAQPQRGQVVSPQVFIDVSVRNQAEHQPPEADGEYPPSVRNPLLFSLGVMLLELAFSEPLRAMRRSVDGGYGQPDHITDLNTAFRQSRVASQTLGIKYSEITKKCLYCDFGRGDNLSSPHLQQEIYQEVVCGLMQLEEGFHALHSGS